MVVDTMRFVPIATTLCFAGLTLVGAARGESKGQDPKLVTSTGEASVRRNQFLAWHSLRPGDSLPADSELRCAGVCAVRTADGSTVTLDPGSRVTVGQLTFVPMEENGPAALGRSFELREGAVSVSAAVDAKRPRTVVIGTPEDAKVAARPGLVRVRVGGRSGVSCIEGGARVKLAGHAVDLTPGEATGAVSGTALSPPHPLAAPPAWSPARGRPEEPRHVAVAMGGVVGPVGIGWNSFPGATGYRVQVARDRQFAEPIESASLPAAQTLFLLGTAKSPGTYYARLQVVDASGAEGRFSPPVQLEVVAVGLPAGATVDARGPTVVAPAGAMLTLPEMDGFELAIDDQPFRKAPAQIPVDGASHVAALRLASDFGREARFKIEPRALRADIKIGPALARWPLDPVDVSVRVEDPSGSVDVASVTPRVAVLIGVEEIPVEWHRQGSALVARIAPRDVVGFSVIRIVVTDEHGALLGRNFLEVKGRPPPLQNELLRANSPRGK